jgi:hypothetical protein
MTPSFLIEVDAGRSLVRISLSGFFNPDDVNRFVEARDDAHRQLRCGPNEHLTLVDIRDMQIQSQDIVEAFATMLSKPECKSKRIAFIVTQSLARLQIKRAASGRGAGYFNDDPVAAEAWLLGDLEDTRAA